MSGSVHVFFFFWGGGKTCVQIVRHNDLRTCVMFSAFVSGPHHDIGQKKQTKNNFRVQIGKNKRDFQAPWWGRALTSSAPASSWPRHVGFLGEVRSSFPPPPGGLGAALHTSSLQTSCPQKQKPRRAPKTELSKAGETGNAGRNSLSWHYTPSLVGHENCGSLSGWLEEPRFAKLGGRDFADCTTYRPSDFQNQVAMVGSGRAHFLWYQGNHFTVTQAHIRCSLHRARFASHPLDLFVDVVDEIHFARLNDSMGPFQGFSTVVLFMGSI